jgi:hypothetical protein
MWEKSISSRKIRNREKMSNIEKIARKNKMNGTE